MKTLLTIGYNHFILPASVNVNAILAALQKAQPVRKEYKADHHVYYPETGRGAEISIELIKDSHVHETKKLKAIPEHASPDAHNTFGS
jgi:hypothetical protein